jgi:hypothetical protein
LSGDVEEYVSIAGRPVLRDLPRRGRGRVGHLEGHPRDGAGLRARLLPVGVRLHRHPRRRNHRSPPSPAHPKAQEQLQTRRENDEGVGPEHPAGLHPDQEAARHRHRRRVSGGAHDRRRPQSDRHRPGGERAVPHRQSGDHRQRAGQGLRHLQQGSRRLPGLPGTTETGHLVGAKNARPSGGVLAVVQRGRRDTESEVPPAPGEGRGPRAVIII